MLAIIIAIYFAFSLDINKSNVYAIGGSSREVIQNNDSHYRIDPQRRAP